MGSYIQLSNVAKGYELEQQAVSLFEDINLTINSGQSTAIIGSSGAGKSTLLLMCAGLETADNGTLDYHRAGQPLCLNSLRARTGFIFQQFHLLPELNALQNVALPLKLKGVKGAEAQAATWLEKVGLAERAKHKPSQLSGGEQQRVAIARCLASQPDFIFADEPTGNLDEATAQSVTDLLFALIKEQGAALTLVTHNTELAKRCDTILSLKNGQLTQVQLEETQHVG